jgi:DNA-binding transcriptional LysR family regulator
MLDAVSLDQLRTFIAAVDEGSFSAASRKLLRSQSVVSETIGNLEDQIGLRLFDRSGRYPKLTAAGSAILGDARGIITGVDLLKARAKGMSAGLEPELSVVVDVFYPIDAITQVAKEFRQKYPGVALRIYVEALGGAIKPVLDGSCSIGIVGSLPVIPDTLTYERFPGIAFLMVAASDHALASYRGKIPRGVLAKHTQIVLTDRSELSSGREFGVMSSATWRLADLFAKHHFLLKGLGWGGMPLHVVRKDLEEGRLCVLPIEDVPPDGLILTMSAVWQTKSPPGSAGRWFLDRLKQIPVEAGKVPKPPVTRKKAKRSVKS